MSLFTPAFDEVKTPNINTHLQQLKTNKRGSRLFAQLIESGWSVLIFYLYLFLSIPCRSMEYKPLKIARDSIWDDHKQPIVHNIEQVHARRRIGSWNIQFDVIFWICGIKFVIRKF